MNWNFLKSATIFIVSASAAAFVVGGVVGAVGNTIPIDARQLAALALSIAGLVLLAVDVRWRLPLVQSDRQTRKRWIDQGAASWAIKTGAELGVGATTRIAFPVWYAVPAVALLAGSPVAGAAVWAGYAFIRTTGSVLMAWYSFVLRPGFHAERALALSGRISDVRVASNTLAVVCLAALAVALW